MSDFVASIIAEHGLEISVVRGGSTHNEQGAKNEDSHGRFFCFPLCADIKEQDILKLSSGDEYIAVSVEKEHEAGKPAFKKAYYQSVSQYRQQKQGTTVFNIQSAYGSIIGNQESPVLNYNSTLSELKERAAADTSPDKEDIERIISLLEMIVNGQLPPSKGLFSKFSAVMERHSWLSNSVAGAILSWLTSQIL